MFRIGLLLFLSALVLQACTISPSGTWQNDHIEKSKRDQIRSLNDKLLKAILADDTARIKAMASDSFLNGRGKDFNAIIHTASKALVNAKAYRVLGEYNTRNAATGVANSIPSGVSADSDYILTYKVCSKESYISLIIPDGSPDNELMIGVQYGRYDNEWLIDLITIGQYSYFNKTAIDYYKIARECHYNTFVIDAVDNMVVARQCLFPGAKLFHYALEKEIDTFYKQVLEEANTRHKFPMELEWVETKPKVLGAFPQMVSEGFFPMIYYQTSISLDDTIALKKENEQVHSQMEQYYPDLEKEKYVFYWAFNELPDGKKLVKHYGFVIRGDKQKIAH